jgi:hypothetical protein
MISGLKKNGSWRLCLTKQEKSITEQIKNEQVRNILQSIQEHDLQLTPLALEIVCKYIKELENGRESAEGN